MFRKAKVPLVVAVNSQVEILDEASALFSRHFYHGLFEGETPQRAFEHAKRTVVGSHLQMQSCCCAHPHKENCKWLEVARKEGFSAAHKLHVSNCKCPMDKNRHLSNCKFPMDFEMLFIDIYTATDIGGEPGEDGKVAVCCCMPDEPHDESIKFMLIGSDQDKNTPIVKNLSNGELQIDAEQMTFNRLPTIIDSQMLVGRNKEVQSLVQCIAS